MSALLALGALGLGAVGAAGSIWGGIEAKDAADKQAKQQERFGRMVRDDTRDATRDLIESQVAASNSNEGSAVELQLDAAVEGELAALRAMLGYQNQADATRSAGSSAQIAGILGGGSTLLASSFQALSMQPSSAIQQPLLREPLSNTQY